MIYESLFTTVLFFTVLFGAFHAYHNTSKESANELLAQIIEMTKEYSAKVYDQAKNIQGKKQDNEQQQ